MHKSTPRVRISEARSQLTGVERLTGQSARRFDEISGRFELFLQRGFSVEWLDEVTIGQAERFISAKSSDSAPSTATMHLRRSVLRMLFRVAHETWGFDGDPTLRIYLPPRSGLAARPLTDDEVALGRSFSLHTLTSTRQPAAWALSEATANTAELPHVTVDDLDLDCTAGPRVWLHGSRKRDERWGYLEEWGAQQVERRASGLKGTRHLIYQCAGSEESQQRSCCAAITETLVRCGLDAEPDVRPASLVAWAGRNILSESDKIEVVAQRLGLRSLDAAARFIDFGWND